MPLRLILIISIALTTIPSCHHPRHVTLLDIPLKTCDQVNIVYYNHNDTLSYKTTDSLELAALTELISTDNNNIADTCRPSGQLFYNVKNKTLLIAEFSTTASNESGNCDYITYLTTDKYKHGLTNRAQMLIDDILWHKLKWSSVVDHGPIRLLGDTANVKNLIH